MARRIMTALVLAALALAALGIALRIYMGRDAESRLAAEEAVSITELRSPLPKAGFLACPPNYCAAAEAVPSPVFDMPWTRLLEYSKEVIFDEPRITRVETDADPKKLVYIQQSATFRFPDIITVELVPLGPDRSSIAIYSRSRYGEHDFGKNRKRVERWLVLLERMARPVASRAPAR